MLKLFCAAMLFDAGGASREVVSHLRDVLDEPGQVGLLAQMVGTDLKFFKRKVRTHPYANEGGGRRRGSRRRTRGTPAGWWPSLSPPTAKR